MQFCFEFIVRRNKKYFKLIIFIIIDETILSRRRFIGQGWIFRSFYHFIIQRINHFSNVWGIFQLIQKKTFQFIRFYFSFCTKLFCSNYSIEFYDDKNQWWLQGEDGSLITEMNIFFLTLFKIIILMNIFYYNCILFYLDVTNSLS